MQQHAVQTSFGSFGPPPDPIAWGALTLALLLFVAGFKWRARLESQSVARALAPSGAQLSRREAGYLAAMALGAALLSWGYIVFYLRGGPRIIDATSYWLESRAFASGQWAFAVPSPSASFSGRFLLPSADGTQLSPIFPPGYPAALAVFQRLGAPLLLGPLLGAALVLTSFGCARRLFPHNLSAAWIAAGFALFSATLRYHTADTMSHGFCAVLFSAAVCLALGPSRAGSDTKPDSPRPGAHSAWGWLGAGLCLGLLTATRPVTGGVLGLLLGWLLLRGGVAHVQAARRQIAQEALALALGSLPGVVLLVWHQRANTGAFGDSTQLAYYALADGPPGCFGYGFGARGCMYEHGDFVRAQLPHGYGLWQALGTSARRLKAHLLDAGNLELFCLALPFIAWRGRSVWAVRFLSTALALQLVAYAPFYFDGNYPGGGARLLVDVLPLELALLAYGIAAWSHRWLAPGLCLLGFALHGSYEHQNLSRREGGEPMFHALAFNDGLSVVGTGQRITFAEHLTKLRTANPKLDLPAAVVFVDTDHGFNLGHSPALFQRIQAGTSARSSSGQDTPLLDNLLVARRTYDAREELLLRALGGPPSFRYWFDPGGKARGTWVDYQPTPLGKIIRLEAEYDWPPTQVSGGWAHPDWPPGECVSLRRGLRLRASSGAGPVRARLEIVGPRAGRYAVTTHWARMRPSHVDPSRPQPAAELELREQGAPEPDAVRHSLDIAPGACVALSGPALLLPEPKALGRLPSSWLQVSVTQEDFVLDWIELRAL